MNSSRPPKTKHFHLRVTDRQESLIRTGAQLAGTTVAHFIIETACLQAEHALSNKREFAVSALQWHAFVPALNLPARIKPELARLFTEAKATDHHSAG